MATKLPTCKKKRALSVSDSGIGKSSILSVTTVTAGRTRLVGCTNNYNSIAEITTLNVFLGSV